MSGNGNGKNEYTGVKGWVEERLPIFSFLKHQGEYRTPKNLSYAWNLGSIAGVALLIQIITGVLLSMHYTPHADHAFDSVERIMRDVPGGWLIRYLHAVGASMFFIAIYLHIARAFFYGSYKKPREILWFVGILIFLLMMASAFLGYVLPWGQMSFWGATVITNLFSSIDSIIPGLGTKIVQFLWGGYSVDNPTLNRFFALHFLLPLVLVGVVMLHLIALHTHGSNNPSGVEVKDEKKDTIPFHPYYTVKDFFGFGIYFIIFFYFTFFMPNSLGHPDNYIPADPLVTPPHIVPEWYFLPFYAILRAVPSKLGGVVLMFGAILIWFLLPWLDRSKVKSGKFRPLFKPFYWIFIFNFVFLGWLGAKPAEGVYILMGQFATTYYFLYFLVILPLLPRFEKITNLPDSIDDYYKKKKSKASKGSKVMMLIICLFMGVAGTSVVSVVSISQSFAAGGSSVALKQKEWHFDGVFGSFDRRAIQRGYQVYREVCSACHGMRLVAYRNLADIGFSEDEVKAIAASYQLEDGPDDVGDMFMRSGLPSDRFVSPFPNENAARAANGGAYPPDLSLITKARMDGPNYVYSLLTGYKSAEEIAKKIKLAKKNGDEESLKQYDIAEGKYFNIYYPGNAISMAAPLADGTVDYMDGTEATMEQMAYDVVNFLQWAAEPEMEERKQMGIKVLIFMLVFTMLFHLLKIRTWKDVT